MIFKFKTMSNEEQEMHVPLDIIRQIRDDKYLGNVDGLIFERVESLDETEFIMEVDSLLNQVAIMLVEMDFLKGGKIAFFKKPSANDYSSKIKIGSRDFLNMFISYIMDYMQDNNVKVGIKFKNGDAILMSALNISEEPITETFNSENEPELMDWFLEVANDED